MQITIDQITKIVGTAKAGVAARILPGLNECLIKYNITTALRVNHFLAQVLHESGCFLYFEELATGKAYEGRKDLGNIHPGDGIKYKGRGCIQLTGLANYTAISHDLNVDFVNNPKLLANDEYGIVSAGWFWNSRGLNIFADKDDIETITRRINGGLNGFDSRKAWLVKCKSIIVDVHNLP
jgi:putative chitinase